MKTSKFWNTEISVKWKIFAYFSLFALIMILLLWLFQIVFLNSFYRAIKTNEIYSTAKNIETLINSNDLDSEIQTHSYKKDICIMLYNKSANKIYSSNVLMNCMIHKIPFPMLYESINQKLSNKNESFELISSEHRRFGPSPNSILLAKRFFSKSGEEFILILNSVIEPVTATTTTLRSQLICITIIMLILAFLLSLIISKKISKPIISINNSAKKLADEYNLKFEDTGYKEISELADTLTLASQELSKVENLRRELIANVSHDLRTPLTMIIGYAEVMKDIPGENNPENVQIIIDEAKRLTGLVNDMLDISKLQTGAQELNKTKFNLTKCIENILVRYSKLTEKDGYQIIFEKDLDVEIEGDELKLTQVIYNLINNAITYTGEDKKIIIKQTVIDNEVKIEIVDSGDGIKDEELPYIWNRYYKAKGNHKRASVGTGLGLAIVKNILKLHEAKFGVKNNPEKGATFWFSLTK